LGFDYLKPVRECDALDDFWQLISTSQSQPPFLSLFYELKDHHHCGVSFQAALGSLGPVADGREGALDGVCGANVFPMLGRKIIECQESIPVFFQAGDSFFVFDVVFCTEEIKGFSGIVLGIRHLLPGRACLHARDGRFHANPPWPLLAVLWAFC